MADLSTKYLGLQLNNPIIAGSSSLSENIEGILELDKHGVGAIVLKSLFEEEIQMEMQEQQRQMQYSGGIYPEIFDMFDLSTVEDSVSKYLFLITEAKKKVKTPIIASINCVSANEWPEFAKRLESAGADALELNAFIMPSDFNHSGADNEKVYFDIVEKVKKSTSIPVAMKVSCYFSNLAQMLQKLSNTGLDALVLFNRFFAPDIDIEGMKIDPSSIYSEPSDLPISLRWIAIMSGRVNCQLAASTGIHDGQAVVKQLLAGADTVQIASVLYKNGLKAIPEMLQYLSSWMDKKGFATIDDFRGKMNMLNSANPAAYERAQFMRHFSGKLI